MQSILAAPFKWEWNRAYLSAAFTTTAGASGSLGKIAEVIGLPRVATAADKTALAAYFLPRYGLTVT